MSRPYSKPEGRSRESGMESTDSSMGSGLRKGVRQRSFFADITGEVSGPAAANPQPPSLHSTLLSCILYMYSLKEVSSWPPSQLSTCGEMARPSLTSSLPLRTPEWWVWLAGEIRRRVLQRMVNSSFGRYCRCMPATGISMKFTNLFPLRLFVCFLQNCYIIIL